MIALRNTRKLDLISVNPNQSLLAQLNENDRKKSALKNGLNNRFKVHNNLVGYDDLTMAQKMNTTALAIRQVENIGLVYVLVKDTACNGLNKCHDFIFDIDNPFER
ncbi:hypothetical protein BIZ50_04540 [Helicobacter pylori]|nr:hypothetical protein BIZ44_05880 [Helicobacter pylori]OLR46890.1 hypothetical protein BIZ50_04540 [Helicobacter pylori]